MLLKSQKRAYVGYEDGSKSVKYYSADTRRILTSRNYRFLNVVNVTPPEEIVVAPDLPHEGETNKDTLQTSSDSRKRKVIDEGDHRESSKRAKRVDYRYLNDPFEDELEEQNNTYIDPLYAPETLKEAKNSGEWEQWDKAVKLELDQLEKTGT